MRLAPAVPLLITRRGCPFAFDVVDADAPRPQPIIGRAQYLEWKSKQGEIWYHVHVTLDDKLYTANICIYAREKFN